MSKIKKNKQIIKNILNLIILFLGIELIGRILSGIPEFKNIDFRLFFIFIIADYMGMKYGIVSAILASLTYIMQNFGDATDMSIIFLNTNNWLRMVIYIVLAVIIGLKHDKEMLKIESYEHSIDELNEKEKIVEKKVELYEKELKEFNEILLTNRNGYMQIAGFIEEFNNVKNDELKTKELLQSVLNNETCELKSMQDISKYIDNEKIDIMSKEKIWINRKLDKDLPNYIAPISTNDQNLAIVIWNCPFEQMNIEYRNRIIGIANIISYVLVH